MKSGGHRDDYGIEPTGLEQRLNVSISWNAGSERTTTRWIHIGDADEHDAPCLPEGRQIFGPLSVEDNLRLGAYLRRDKDIDNDRDKIFGMFPILQEKRKLLAGGLSGGQQQMLAIGRALMGRPKLLLLDEPSLGLSPLLVDQILAAIVSLRKAGITVLLVEQNAAAALEIADRGYVIETGRIVHSGPASALLSDPKVKSAYLGFD